MSAQKKNPPPSEKLELYDKLIASIPEVERKGASIAYTSLNGHMFSFISNDGEMGLRLPEKERNEFLQKYDTSLSVQYGSVMKEYARVPDALLARTDELKPYFQISFNYIKALKPTKK